MHLVAVEPGLFGVGAMRSQVSSTESKVSREWSAKRARSRSDSMFSQSYSKNSVVWR
jgi:hypothetical protein